MTGLAAIASAQTTISVYNDDSVNHTYPVTACGKASIITPPHNRTTPITIKGCGTAVITTPAGPLNVKNGDKVYIKNGKLEIVSSFWLKHVDFK